MPVVGIKIAGARIGSGKTTSGVSESAVEVCVGVYIKARHKPEEKESEPKKDKRNPRHGAALPLPFPPPQTAASFVVPRSGFVTSDCS